VKVSSASDSGNQSRVSRCPVSGLKSLVVDQNDLTYVSHLCSCFLNVCPYHGNST